ncbi:transcription factor VBP-like [Amyelois transitella]|uniref:transcription factor VBP-like n=1 Tax=Amyelois transitella TaxID=680683 RepID=UPI00067A9EC8|nr:transcription factor VBP-like [Amyelois transitella]
MSSSVDPRPETQEQPLDLTKKSCIPQTQPATYYVYSHLPRQPSYEYIYQAPYTVPSPLITPPETANRPSSSVQCSDTESLAEDVEYLEFERDALHAMAERNGGRLLSDNPRMRRAVQGSGEGDDTYRKQRERNNVAAKQSRDRRKLREMRLTLQVTFLKKKLRQMKAREKLLCGRCRVQVIPNSI